MKFFKNNKILLVFIVILLLLFTFLLVFIQNRNYASIKVYKRVPAGAEQKEQLTLTKEDKKVFETNKFKRDR